MQKLLLSIFVILPTLGYCQIGKTGIQLKPIVGFRIHNDAMEELQRGGTPKLLTSPVLGLEIGHREFPISLGYQKDFNVILWNYLSEYDEPWTVSWTWEEDQLQLYWKLKHFSMGVGHYWKKRENALHHLGPGLGVLRRKGVQLSLVYPTKWVDIELRTKIQYDPGFAAIGSAMHSILFLYRISKREERVVDRLHFFTVNGIIGVRVFHPEIKLIPGEEFNKSFSLAPGLGLEFLFDKINTSINLEKDWWVYFNGGSPVRDIRGLINNSFIGIKYHYQLKNERHLRVGLGGSWIEDDENKRKNNTDAQNGILSPIELDKVFNYQVKGIGASLSYEILPNTDVELKTTIPFIGEKAFESTSRTSLGIFYRFNPFRKKLQKG